MPRRPGREAHPGTDDLGWLVDTAYGVAGELHDLDPELAKDLASQPEAKRGQGNEDGFTVLERQLVQVLFDYGTTSDEQEIGRLSQLYHRAVDESAPERRLRILLFVIEKVELRRFSGNALMPFIFRDDDARVISAAALHAAGVWTGTEDDPMIGVRELTGLAPRAASDGDERRAAAISPGSCSSATAA